MSVDKDTPTFNLKVVVRETGIKADTLRAWERRYGLPDPARTSGGHRLYSQHDIDMLKWMVARQNEGLTISRAVDLWRSLEEEGQDPLQAMPLYVGAATRPPIVPSTSGDMIADLRETWITACLEFDEQRADQAVTQALGLYPPEVVVSEILQSGLSQIGDLWYEGAASVQQEHFASGLAVRRVEALLATSPPPTRPGRIMVACPPDEIHTFGPLVLSFLLRRHGWDVLYLGANVPIDHMTETIQTTNPGLVVLAAQQLSTAASLSAAAHAVSAADTLVAFGGRIFSQLPDAVDYIPGIYLGDDISAAVGHIDEIMMKHPAPASVNQPAESYALALEAFKIARPSIESKLYYTIDELQMEQAHFAQGIQSLNDAVEAALSLGSLDLLVEDFDWIEGLLTHQEIPHEMLFSFLGFYQEAIGNTLNSNGDLIVEWFEDYLDEAEV